MIIFEQIPVENRGNSGKYELYITTDHIGVTMRGLRDLEHAKRRYQEFLRITEWVSTQMNEITNVVSAKLVQL